MVWPTDKISQPFAVLRSQAMFTKCDMPVLFLQSIDQGQYIVLLDINERARSLTTEHIGLHVLLNKKVIQIQNSSIP